MSARKEMLRVEAQSEKKVGITGAAMFGGSFGLLLAAMGGLAGIATEELMVLMGMGALMTGGFFAFVAWTEGEKQPLSWGIWIGGRWQGSDGQRSPSERRRT